MESEYKLELSRDAGINYQVVEESNNLFDLKDKCEEFDKKGWRWVVKDSNKKIVMACAIFGEIMTALNSSDNVQIANNKESTIKRLNETLK